MRATMEAILSGDPNEIMPDTQGMFQEFLRSDGQWIVKVLSLSTTCGSGFSVAASAGDPDASANISSADTCIVCPRATYKYLLDNSPCSPCPKHSSTNITGALDISACACDGGFRTANESTQDASGAEQVFACVSSTQYISTQEAADAAESVSTAVGVIVAANVAVAVGTSVGVSVSSAVAASSGGAVGGAVGGSGGAASGSSSAGSSSSSGTLSLITQVQFLNQVGRIGGSKGSESLGTFTDGFKWANFDLGLSIGNLCL